MSFVSSRIIESAAIHNPMAPKVNGITIILFTENVGPLKPEHTTNTSKMDATIVAVTECLRMPKNRGIRAIAEAESELIVYLTTICHNSAVLSGSVIKS
jgi:hypothetical protein